MCLFMCLFLHCRQSKPLMHLFCSVKGFMCYVLIFWKNSLYVLIKNDCSQVAKGICRLPHLLNIFVINFLIIQLVFFKKSVIHQSFRRDKKRITIQKKIMLVFIIKMLFKSKVFQTNPGLKIAKSFFDGSRFASPTKKVTKFLFSSETFKFPQEAKNVGSKS